MKPKIWALVFLIMSSTLASGDCCPPIKEDEIAPEHFNFSAFTWDGNNTTCLQKVPDEESEAILESLMDSGWVGNNTTYLQKVPDEKVGAILGDVEPSIQKDDAVYIMILPLPYPLVLLVVEYALQNWIEKNVKASMGSSGFTCKCGVDYTDVSKFSDCCATVKEEWKGHTWEHHFGSCEKGCNTKCDSEWDRDIRRWKMNICSRTG